MTEAGNGLLVSRILVLKGNPHAVLRVELANSYPRLEPEEWPDPQHRRVQVLRADELAQLAQKCTVGGVLFVGKRSAVGRSGLPRLLQRLRLEYAGWVGLEVIGPEPQDLGALLREPLVDFLDVQLAWPEMDLDSGESAVLVNPSLRQIVPILLEARCPCVIRFTQPAEESSFGELSAVFDTFVRVSADPVAVQVVEPFEQVLGSGSGAARAAEFIACRPAWLVRQSQGQWYQVQPDGQGLPQGRACRGDPRRRRRRRM